MADKADFITRYNQQMDTIKDYKEVISVEQRIFEQRTAAARDIIRETYEEAGKNVLAFLKQEGLSALSDENSARFVYQAGWLSGRGVDGFTNMLQQMIEPMDTSISVPFGGWYSSAEDYSDIIFRLAVVLDDERKDDERLNRTAEVLEPILRAQMKISMDAHAEVIYDSYNGHVRPPRIVPAEMDGQYDYVTYGTTSDFTGTLREVLAYARKVADY